jgi:type III restriction enzyme
MYVVKKTNGEKSLNIVVETKDVENQTDLRGIEKAKINCAKVFFSQLTIDGYKVEFHEQLNNKKIKQIIEDVLKVAE